MATPTLELADVQGLVVSGYGKMHESRWLLLGVRDAVAARSWLAGIARRVTTSEAPEERWCVNVAITSEGLRALGVAEPDLQTFAAPFVEGMAAEHRRHVLGDVGPSAPEHWAWGRPDVPDRAVHVLLLLYATDLGALGALLDEVRPGIAAGGLEVVHELRPEPLPGQGSAALPDQKFGIEHFGFADGMSQPIVAGTGQEANVGGDEARRSVIAAGEFVLGYPNGYGERTPAPRLDGDDDFGRNGTYLVVRQLSQDVAGFWRYLDAQTKGPDGSTDAEAQVRLGAKLVGRWPSGAPLVRSPHRDDPDLGADNAFQYADRDPHGERCPLGSHIRRTNPRDSLGTNPRKALELANLHRIVRRGRVYGPGLDRTEPDDGQERGLLFACLNANLDRQFEFVQHTWCNNPKFDRLYDEQDPLLGNSVAPGSFTVQDRPFRRRVQGVPSFVTTRGGAYFFLPGVRALRRLAAMDA